MSSINRHEVTLKSNEEITGLSSSSVNGPDQNLVHVDLISSPLAISGNTLDINGGHTELILSSVNGPEKKLMNVALDLFSVDMSTVTLERYKEQTKLSSSSVNLPNKNLENVDLASTHYSLSAMNYILGQIFDTNSIHISQEEPFYIQHIKNKCIRRKVHR